MLMLSDYRSRQRDYLLEIIRALTQELDLTALLGRILKISIEMLSGQACLIALRSDAGEWSVPVSQNLPQPFINYLQPYFADLPATSDPETAELPEISRVLTDLTRSVSMGMLGGFGLPLVARQKVVGVIFIFRGGTDSFSPNDRALLRSFADQAAIAVQNAQLYTQVSQEKQRMDALLDSAADGILILSSSRTIERCNPAFLRLLDLKKEAIQLKKHDELIQFAAEEPAPAEVDVPVQAHGLVLCQHQHLANAAVEAVGQREIDDPIAPAERDGRFGAVTCKRLQSRPFSACQHDRQCI